MEMMALILAGGVGSRMGTDLPKQYIHIHGKPVLAYTLASFEEADSVEGYCVVAHPIYHEMIKQITASGICRKFKGVISSGNTRQESSRHGVEGIGSFSPAFVCIHDAARPFVTPEIIDDVFSSAKKYGAAVSCVHATDTIYYTNPDGVIAEIPDRALLYNAQTPQIFSYDLIMKAHKEAVKKNIQGITDDAGLVVRMGHEVMAVEGSYTNIKLTTPKDLDLAAGLLSDPSFQ